VQSCFGRLHGVEGRGQPRGGGAWGNTWGWGGRKLSKGHSKGVGDEPTVSREGREFSCPVVARLLSGLCPERRGGTRGRGGERNEKDEHEKREGGDSQMSESVF